MNNTGVPATEISRQIHNFAIFLSLENLLLAIYHDFCLKKNRLDLVICVVFFCAQYKIVASGQSLFYEEMDSFIFFQF